MSRTGRPPIKLDKETIISLYGNGLPCQQIGPIFQVSWATIDRRLQKWGIQIRHRAQKGICPFTKEECTKGNPSRFKGHRHTAKSREKMSASQRGQNTWSRGRKLSLDTKAKMSNASKLKWQDPEFRVNQIKRMEEKWADPHYANRVRQLIIKGNYKRPTQPEQCLINIISKYKLPFKYTGDGSVQIEGFHPDFVNYNGAKVVIEVFGDYWHGKAARTWRQTELGRIMAFNSIGFKCIVIWEKELNILTDAAIAKRIRNETRRVSLLCGQKSKR